MSENKQRYIYIEGQAVPVSEDVYRVCKHYERKEEYFSYDLKCERFQRDTNTFLPSREDSYDRLLEQNKQFASESKPVEEKAVSSVWMAEFFRRLTGEERQIIKQLYILERTEREACAAKVQEIRQQRHRRTKTGKSSLFSGMVYCADCGAKMQLL